MIIKRIFKYFLYFILSVLGYVLVSILISYITVNKNSVSVKDTKTIYIHSNGVHLSVILSFEDVSESLKKDVPNGKEPKFVKYGWGDENFYLNVPTWDDFKFKYAFGAFFLDNQTVIHITNTFQKSKKWVAVKVNDEELKKINSFLSNSFQLNATGNKALVPQELYGDHNFFYKAKGSYSPIKTCNTWVNDCFKQSGLKASYWTLFDFGLLNKYDK